MDWEASVGGVDDTWIEGIACLPSLKQLRYSQCGRLPSEFYALQLTSLSLGFHRIVLFDAVMVEKFVRPPLPSTILQRVTKCAGLLTAGQDLSEFSSRALSTDTV